MKIFIVYILILLAMFGVVIGLVHSDNEPDYHIVGTWKDTAWHYEELDQTDDQSDPISSEIDHHTKRAISEGLVFHEAEIWSFTPNGKVVLVNAKGEKKHVDYDLKDQNVLKLQGIDSGAEHYQIKKISPEKMEIHFSTDIKTGGVVKMIFEKIPSAALSYAKKV